MEVSLEIRALACAARLLDAKINIKSTIVCYILYFKRSTLFYDIYVVSSLINHTQSTALKVRQALCGSLWQIINLIPSRISAICMH